MQIYYVDETGEEPVLKKYGTTTTLAAFAVRVFPGVNKRFWAFQTGPEPDEIATWDFTAAPVSNSVPSVNAAAIAAITATPADVFVLKSDIMT